MAADALDVRMARLEGAYEQINARLGTIETRLDSLGSRMDARFNALESRMEARFNWVIGLLPTSWVTLMLAILLHR
jgi:hypothetical protein